MADEFAVQQDRPSALPYLATGAAVGGTAGYLGLPRIEGVKNWVTEPAKYASYDDIIKESEDNFVKAAKEVVGENDKDWKAIQEQIKNAGHDWDTKLNSYIEQNINKTDLELLPKDHELVKKYQEVKKAKIDELIDVYTKNGKTAEDAKKLAEETVKKEKANLFEKELADIQKEKLKNAFVKDNGSKNEAINKALESSKDDVAKLLERKNIKGKFALVIAGAMAAGALLGLAFRPNAKEV